MDWPLALFIISSLGFFTYLFLVLRHWWRNRRVKRALSPHVYIRTGRRNLSFRRRP